MIIQSDVDMCKAKLASMIGQTVKLTSNGGRKRIITRVGVIETCYPNFFTVRCTRKADGNPELVSHRYVDILTKTVRLAIPTLTAEEVAS